MIVVVLTKHNAMGQILGRWWIELEDARWDLFSFACEHTLQICQIFQINILADWELVDFSFV